jgi:nicotinamide-nucleotide amidase
MDKELDSLSAEVGAWLQARGWTLACAESCTGGWVAQVVTATAGSSGWFDRGFVTYSNAAKMDMLGVSPATLAAHGAVSEETVQEMVIGALAASRADVALAVSGIAGPSGGSPDKPVGMVCFAWSEVGEAPRSTTRRFTGDREAVRRQAVVHALRGLLPPDGPAARTEDA